MKEFLENPGLFHIVNHISSYLDRKSIAQCRLVCQSWKDSIDYDRSWLVFQLEHIQSQEKTFVDYAAEGEPKVKGIVQERFPEWQAFIQQISRKQRIFRLKKVVEQMWIYLKDEKTGYDETPLHWAAEKSNVEFVQLLVDCGIDLKMTDPDGWTPMHSACRYANLEMVQWLIKHTPTFDATSKTNIGCTIFHFAV